MVPSPDEKAEGWRYEGTCPEVTGPGTGTWGCLLRASTGRALQCPLICMPVAKGVRRLNTQVEPLTESLSSVEVQGFSRRQKSSLHRYSVNTSFWTSRSAPRVSVLSAWLGLGSERPPASQSPAKLRALGCGERRRQSIVSSVLYTSPTCRLLTQKAGSSWP